MSINNVNVTAAPQSDYHLVEITTSQVLASRGRRTPTGDAMSPGEAVHPVFSVRDSQGRLRLLTAGQRDPARQILRTTSAKPSPPPESTSSPKPNGPP